MSWQNQGGNDRKNPWGKNRGSGPGGSNNNGPRGPWGGGNGGDLPPDLDEMLRRAQANLRQVMPHSFGGGGGRMAGLAVIALIGVWLASGLYTIEPGTHGVIQQFGKWDRTKVEEGLGYRLPWPIESLTKVSVSQVRRMEIGFVQMAGRGGLSQKQDVPEESLMLTSDANIVNLDMVVLWNIKSAEDYTFNIFDPENTIKKVAESAIREVVGQTEMFPIITQAREEVAQKVRDIMARNLDQYKSGVNIAQVLIQQAEVHPDVQDAFQDVQSAKQDAEDVQNRADAYRQDILPRARGEAIRVMQEAQAYKQSTVAKATGDAERFNAIFSAYEGNQDVTKTRLYIEAMEDVLQNAQKIILDENAGSGVVPYLPLNELKPAAGAPAKAGEGQTP